MLLTDEPRHLGGLGYYQKTIGVDDLVGFFSLNPAVALTTPATTRCDGGTWGPTSFHRMVDGVCDCGGIDASTGDICQYGVADLSFVTFASALVSEPPVGYICYTECVDPQDEVDLCAHHWNSNARTLQELLKLIIEWADCYSLLDALEPIAHTAFDFLTVLAPPYEVEQWLRTEMPDGPVLRFLQGDPDARVRPVEIPDMPDIMSEWLWGRLDRNMSFGRNNPRNAT